MFVLSNKGVATASEIAGIMPDYNERGIPVILSRLREAYLIRKVPAGFKLTAQGLREVERIVNLGAE